ncbi:hypothetical protein BTW01_15030 [Bacillus sp. SKDU12]|nr:hypothetical protein BTW01_15030 [Bacillus sp. SKDU12]
MRKKNSSPHRIRSGQSLFFTDMHELFTYWFVSLSQLVYNQHKITLVSDVKFQEGGVGFAESISRDDEL